MASGSTTIAEVIDIQKKEYVLYPPGVHGVSPQIASGNAPTFTVGLYNATQSGTVYCYVTGIAIDNNSQVCLLESDGVTLYYPSNPSSNGSSLSTNCAIALGAVGTTRNITVPHLAGARIWFCIDQTLDFYLNPGQNGPGLVEPSPSNTGDSNYYKQWDFCEFTYNSAQVYANITYVDFASIPIALTLTTGSGTTQHVSGLSSGGLDSICSNLVAQHNNDGAPWDQLVVQNGDTNLRAVSPNTGISLNSSLFQDYWTNYVNAVWTKYDKTPLLVDTQASWGTVTGTTSSGSLTFDGIGSFTKPAARDIFSAASGAFAAQPNNTAELLAIGARIDAAFNRSTLLIDTQQPDGEVVSDYYQNSVTNHYARIVHAANLDNQGYCHPYDDVTPNGGINQSGAVYDEAPQELLVTVGGSNAYAKVRRRRGLDTQQHLVPPAHGKRSLGWAEDPEDHLTLPAYAAHDTDFEYGAHAKLRNDPSSTSWAVMANEDVRTNSSSTILNLPPILDRLFGCYLDKLQSLPYAQQLRPVFDILSTFLVSFLGLSLRAMLSRIFLLVLVCVVYMLSLIPYGTVAAPVSVSTVVEHAMSLAGVANDTVAATVAGLTAEHGAKVARTIVW